MTTIGDFQILNRIFTAIVSEQVGGAVPQPREVEALPAGAPGRPAPDVALRWTALLDLCLHPQLFRTGIQKLSPEEDHLTAIIRYLVAKKPRGEVDRDRLDWLLTYLFKRRGSDGAMVGFGAVRESIQRWLGEGPVAALSDDAQNLLADLAAALADVTDMRTFSQLTDSGLIQRGRDIKQSFGDEFFHHEVLPAVVNYNLVFSRRFHSLFARASEQVRGASVGLAEKDYRTTAGDFRRLGEAAAEVGATMQPTPSGSVPRVRAVPDTWAPGPPPPQVTPSAPAATQPATGGGAPLPDDPLEKMKVLGIDPSRQGAKLRTVTNDLAAFAHAAGRSVQSIPMPHSSLPVSDWESAALASEYTPEDHSFRAEFSRQIRVALGVMASMREETALYHEKRASEFKWKPHYDSLIYLLYQASQQATRLEDLARDTRTRGLIEKADHLARTSEKLRAQMQTVAALF